MSIPKEQIKHVVLVVVDTLRQDFVGAYGNKKISTPNLDALAKESIVFKNAYPESLASLPARKAIYTGSRVFPFEKHPADIFDNSRACPGWGPIRLEDTTLAEALSQAGYRTGFISDMFGMFQPGRNYHRGFKQWRWIRGQQDDLYRSGPSPTREEMLRHIPQSKRKDDLEEYWVLKQILMNTAERRLEEDYFAPQVFRAAGEWIQQNSDAENLFLMIESFDPHEPWDPPLHYRRMYDSDDSDVTDLIMPEYGPWRKTLTERELKRLRANYAGEVTMFDRWLGYLMQTMKATGILDETLLVVVSDHGHCLGERGLVSKQGYPLSPEIADLVLMMRLPAGYQGGTVCDEFVQHHDIAPTILSLLSLPQADRMNGIDFTRLLDDSGKTIRDHVTVGWGPFVMVRTPDYWYNDFIWTEKPLLYPMADYPDFTRNIAAENPKICEELHSLAMQDAGGSFPEYLRDPATATPGCTPLTTSVDSWTHDEYSV